MGAIRIEIEADAGHGCDRNIPDGRHVHGCRKMGCIDCEVRRFVEYIRMAALGTVTKAQLVHFPGEGHQVIDDLTTGKRIGSFAITAAR